MNKKYRKWEKFEVLWNSALNPGPFKHMTIVPQGRMAAQAFFTHVITKGIPSCTRVSKSV